MEYYKQGDAANADKIKAAFEKLGYDITGFDMCNDNILFFTYELKGGSKYIGRTNANFYTAHIIKTHPDYKELELPIEPKFKVGDWLAGIDDEGDMATEKIVSFSHNKVLLVDTDGCRTEYPKTELSNFHLWTMADAKDGDVLVNGGFIFIFKNIDDGNGVHYYCAYEIRSHEEYEQFHIACFNSLMGRIGNSYTHYTPATKEQSALLFHKMKEAGYQWDTDAKELKKIKPHYDIANFHAGMPVLVRETNLNTWDYVLFSHYYIGGDGVTRFNAGLIGFTQCIPFNNDTKHLLGTTDMCDEYYVNW